MKWYHRVDWSAVSIALLLIIFVTILIASFVVTFICR